MLFLTLSTAALFSHYSFAAAPALAPSSFMREGKHAMIAEAEAASVKMAEQARILVHVSSRKLIPFFMEDRTFKKAKVPMPRVF